MVLTGCNSINGKCWTGNLTRANWPCFSVYPNNQNNVTGNGTFYLLQFANTNIDSASGWSSNTTYTIGANYGGVWAFSLFIQASNMTGATTILAYLRKNGNDYSGQLNGSQYWDNNSYGAAYTWILPVSAGDTIKAYFYVSGIGSDSVGITGAYQNGQFSGVQIA